MCTLCREEAGRERRTGRAADRTPLSELFRSRAAFVCSFEFLGRAQTAAVTFDVQKKKKKIKGGRASSGEKKRLILSPSLSPLSPFLGALHAESTERVRGTPPAIVVLSIWKERKRGSPLSINRRREREASVGRSLFFSSPTSCSVLSVFPFKKWTRTRQR